MLLAACVVGVALRRRSGASALPAGLLHAAHHASPPPAVTNARLASIIPGVKERFNEELTEVVEASGSPYSARRRVRTAFHADSPARSPRKRGGGL